MLKKCAKMPILLTDRLNFLLVLYSVWLFLRNWEICEVITLKSQENKIFEALLSLHCRVKTCDQSFSDLTNAEGRHLLIDRDEILQKLSTHFFQSFHSRNQYLPMTAVDSSKLEAFVARYMLHTQANRISTSLHCINYARNDADNCYIIFCQKSDAFNELSRHLKPEDIFKQYGKTYDWLFDIANIARLYWILAYTHFCYAFRALSNKSEEIKETNGLKKLAVQFKHGLHNQGFGSDFDWIQRTQIAYEDLVYIIHHEDQYQQVVSDPDCPNRLQVLFADQFPYDFSTPALLREIRRTCLDIPLIFCSNLFKPATPSFYSIRLCSMLAFYNYASLRWVHLFEKINALGYCTVADSNIDALPQMHALEFIGGVDLSYEFSATGYLVPMDCKPLGKHQYLAWGKLGQNMIINCDRKARHRIAPKEIFYAGGIKLYMQYSDLPYQIEFCARLNAIKDKKKILIADSRPIPSKLLSKNHIADFYDAVVSLIASKPEHIFILKPQKIMHFTKTQESKIKELELEGRVIFAPPFGLSHYLFPEVDLVVGLPIYSSILIEACAAGKAIVCYNNLPLPHIIEQHMPSYALVNNCHSLIQSVDMALDGLINYKDLQKYIDPYSDLEGIHRFGKYLEFWIKCIREYGDADTALPHVRKMVEAEF